MAFIDYLVSKFEEAEPLDPGSPGVSGSWCFGRVACRSFLSSPPSFSGSCFQPLCLPSPRPGLRSGLALPGSGPRRAPPSFVFVLAALLAVRFAAWFLDAGVGVPFFVSEFKGHVLEDAAITFIDSGGYESEFWFAACESDQNGYKLEPLVAGCETDPNGYKLELLVAGCEIEQSEEFLIAGLRKTALGFSEFEGFEGKFIPKEDSRKDTSLKSSEAHSFPPHLQAQLLPELCAKTLLLLICFIGCDLAVLVALQVQAFKVGAKTLKVFGEVEDERKKEGEEEEKEYTEDEVKTEENLEEKRYHAFSLLFKEKEEENEEEIEDEKENDTCFQQNAFPVFVEGVGNTIVVMISPQMDLEDLVEMVQTKLGLPSEVFFLSYMGRVLDSVRMKELTRDSSIRVSFRLRGGMMRVPRDSPGQWTCDYCGINRCWATRSTCYRCGEARGHTEELQRHYRNLAREAREKGLSGASAVVGSSCMSPPWAAKAPPPRSVPPRTPRASSPAPWAAPKSLSEVDKIHDNGQTALLRQALELFENCGLPSGILDEIRKVVPPHRPPTRKAPKVSREQIVLDMKKKLEKEEQELRERKISLEQARKHVTEREQKVMDQATIVSALKMELVEYRQSIVNNPTPEVSEDEDVDATPLGVPVAPPPAVPPAVPPENTPLDFGGDDMDEDLIEEAKPPATKRKGEFGVIQVPTNRQEFQQWTTGLDRESVREGLLHFQALNEQFEREDHARQVEAMERASASGTVADDEQPSG